MSFFGNLYKPENYHGFNKKHNYFEGWYYKLVDKSSQYSFVVIPGIIKSGTESKSFIQVISSYESKSYFIEYPSESFSADKKNFNVRIGNNEFSLQKISVDINRDELVLQGEIKFNSLYPWDVTTFSPGVMGRFAFVPFMQTFHGVLSMDSIIAGSLTSNSKEFNFDNGKAYIEKDWGSSFPTAYIWLQANHFPLSHTSIFVSIAKIPWLRNWFTGYICGFLYEGKLYKFATYNRTKLDKFSFENGIAEIIFTRKNQKLKIKAIQKDSFTLLAPYNNSMNNIILESLNSEIEVQFFDNNKLIFHEKSQNAGFEHNGDISILTTK